MSLIEMTVTGSVLILAVLVIRAIGVQKLPKKALILMWELCIIRLLLPISIPLPILPAEPQAIYSSDYLTPAPIPSLNQGTYSHQEPSLAAPETVSPESSHPENAQPEKAALPKIDKRVLWLAGLGSIALYFAVGYTSATRKFRQSLPVESDFVDDWQEKTEARRKISVRYSDRISSPLTYGLLSPVILLPKTTNFKDEKRLNYILEHEYAHIRHLDALKKPAAALVLCLHWFNPLVWVMYLLYNRDMELWCDECVLKKYGEKSRAAYARILIEMEELRSNPQPLLSHFGRNCVQERIVSIMKFKKTTIISAITAVALILAITVTAAATAINPVAKEAKINDASILKQGDDTVVLTKDTTVTPHVEWWTYDEYKAWLENEKVELQGMLGEKSWTGGRGDFIWTQEIIDETIAMYENTLEQIKNGLRVSKTVDGSNDIILAQGWGDDTVLWRNDSVVKSAIPDAEWWTAEEYEQMIAEQKPKLEARIGEIWYDWNGNECKWTREQTDAMLAFYEETLKEIKAGIPYTKPVNGASWSMRIPANTVAYCETHPEIDIKDLKLMIAEEHERLSAEFSEMVDYYQPPQSEVNPEINPAEYFPFGISFDSSGCMLYNDELVRYFCDGAEINKDEWATRYVYFSESGTVDVFTKRETIINADGSTDWCGKLIGLERSTQEEFDKRDIVTYIANEQTAIANGFTVQAKDEITTGFLIEAVTAEGTSEGPVGKSFEEIFAKYEKFGVEYKPCEGGRGDIFLNGEAVSKLVDISPDGSVFECGSVHGGSCNAVCEYDANGNLCGVRKDGGSHHEEGHHEDSHGSEHHGSGFLFPVPDHHNITSHYGSRWGIEHHGIDIGDGRIDGCDIVAAKSGEVITVVNSCTHNYGKNPTERCDCGELGNYCIIDHGLGYTTVYANAAEITVTEGQKVSAGDVIGKVGSTGSDSTGAHLHFEIRINNESVDPEEYI